ncbi:MAG: hypothetical protein ACJA0N_000356 [Pseudohongiellaceae bacterium]|jgi:hypothetical protein
MLFYRVGLLNGCGYRYDRATVVIGLAYKKSQLQNGGRIFSDFEEYRK